MKGRPEIDPVRIKQIYRAAREYSPGLWTAGYKPEDQIGHGVLQAVQALADEVIALRELEDAVREKYRLVGPGRSLTTDIRHNDAIGAWLEERAVRLHG